jgi:hypothetical protein
VPSSDRGVLKTEETRVEDEVQVVGPGSQGVLQLLWICGKCSDAE